MDFSLGRNKNGGISLGFHMKSDYELSELELQSLYGMLKDWLEEDEFPIPLQAYMLVRDKDGFLVGDVSDLSDYLPFLIHDAENDTLEEVDCDNIIDWSSDIDTKPQYDKIYFKKI